MLLLPNKRQSRPLSLPQATVPRVSPKRPLTYSPGSQGSCKRKPLPPRSPFLDFGTCKVQSCPQRKLLPPSRKLSRTLQAHPTPTGWAIAGDEGGEWLREGCLASLLEALRRVLLEQEALVRRSSPAVLCPNGPPPCFPAAASRATWQACAAP